jgi:phosphatidylglycerophosphatase A
VNIVSRNLIRWNRVRGPRATAAFIIATAFGAGLTPLAPGTMGALFGVPLAYFSSEWDWVLRVLFWVFLSAIGTWAATVFDETMETGDNQRIVIDEVIGLGICAWTAGQNLTTLAAAFVLFRFFDIVKPPPVRQLDRWSKKKAAQTSDPFARWYGGFGVIADDIAAGLQGLAVILILQYFRVL